MRTAPASIAAMLTSGDLTLARCVRFVLSDGTTLGFTDHDCEISVYIDEGSGGVTTYSPKHGMTAGDLVFAVGFDSDNVEISVPISDIVTREAVIGRRFNQADVHIFDADWTQEQPAPFAMLKGWIAEARVEGPKAIFEVRSLSDMWNQTVGRLLTPRCSADFGDDLCGVAKVILSAQVAAVQSSMEFTVDLAGSYADQYFRAGELRFVSGVLADLPPVEIVNYNGATGALELFTPMPAAPTVGDALEISRGCSKLKKSTDASLPTCATYSNQRRFRGWDRVPSSTSYLKMPIPGASGA